MSEQQNEAREEAIDTAQRRWVAQHSSPDGLQIHAGAIMCWREGYEAATANHAAEIERLRAALAEIKDVLDYGRRHSHGMYAFTKLKEGYEKAEAIVQSALAGTPEGEDK